MIMWTPVIQQQGTGISSFGKRFIISRGQHDNLVRLRHTRFVAHMMCTERRRRNSCMLKRGG